MAAARVRALRTRQYRTFSSSSGHRSVLGDSDSRDHPLPPDEPETTRPIKTQNPSHRVYTDKMKNHPRTFSNTARRNRPARTASLAIREGFRYRDTYIIPQGCRKKKTIMPSGPSVPKRHHHPALCHASNSSEFQHGCGVPAH